MLEKADLLEWIATRPEAELRQWICEMLGCHAAAQTPAGSHPLVVVPGQVANDAFFFTAHIGTQLTDLRDVTFQLDTGAFEMLLTAEIAQALGLPNEGALDVSGVGGNTTAYRSHVALRLVGQDGDVHYAEVPCVVDPSFTGTPLFGLRFFIDFRITLALDVVAAQLTLYQVA